MYSKLFYRALSKKDMKGIYTGNIMWYKKFNTLCPTITRSGTISLVSDQFGLELRFSTIVSLRLRAITR